MGGEISLKDLMPNEFYINDVGLMCCELSLKEVNQIVDVLTNLQQENQQLCNEIDIWNDKYNAVDRDRKKYYEENQQLKEQLKDENNYHNEAVKWYKEAFDIEQERIKYKSVLDEIREYIKTNHLFNYVYDEEELFEITSDRKAKEDILQILDKVGNNE